MQILLKKRSKKQTISHTNNIMIDIDSLKVRIPFKEIILEYKYLGKKIQAIFEHLQAQSHKKNLTKSNKVITFD